MSNKFKKVISIIMLVTMLAIPTVVYAKSYDTSFNFLVSVAGSTRSYDAGDINLSISSSEEKNGSKSGHTTFSVSLYKKGFIYSTCIGSFDANRVGLTNNGWTNLAKGKYYLYLSKANDKARVKGSISITQ